MIGKWMMVKLWHICTMECHYGWKGGYHVKQNKSEEERPIIITLIGDLLESIEK